MSSKHETSYETDFFAWANEQAALLRAGRLTELDIENVTEEIESLARNEKRLLINYLEALFAILLRWRSQPVFRSRSWELSIEQQRLHLEHHLADSPSLRSHLDDTVATAYSHARYQAALETGIELEMFPPICPFTFDEVMHPDFWPD